MKKIFKTLFLFSFLLIIFVCRFNSNFQDFQKVNFGINSAEGTEMFLDCNGLVENCIDQYKKINSYNSKLYIKNFSDVQLKKHVIAEWIFDYKKPNDFSVQQVTYENNAYLTEKWITKGNNAYLFKGNGWAEIPVSMDLKEINNFLLIDKYLIMMKDNKIETAKNCKQVDREFIVVTFNIKDFSSFRNYMLVKDTNLKYEAEIWIDKNTCLIDRIFIKLNKVGKNGKENAFMALEQEFAGYNGDFRTETPEGLGIKGRENHNINSPAVEGKDVEQKEIGINYSEIIKNCIGNSETIQSYRSKFCYKDFIEGNKNMEYVRLMYEFEYEKPNNFFVSEYMEEGEGSGRFLCFKWISIEDNDYSLIVNSWVKTSEAMKGIHKSCNKLLSLDKYVKIMKDNKPLKIESRSKDNKEYIVITYKNPENFIKMEKARELSYMLELWLDKENNLINMIYTIVDGINQDGSKINEVREQIFLDYNKEFNIVKP